MRINALTGDLIYRQNKTGVHYFHSHFIENLAKNTARYPQCDYRVSCYSSESSIKNSYIDFEKEPSKDNALFSFGTAARVLSYILPIEFFFGKADVYFCDGLIPRTIFPSKKVAVVHDLMVIAYPGNYPLISKLYLNFWLRQCKRADLIIAVSQATKEDLVNYLSIDPNRIRVAYNGGYEEIPPVNNTDCGIDVNCDYVLYIGDMRPNKNLMNAIKGFELLLKSNPSMRFYIAGSKKWDYETINTYILENNLTDNIQFLGYVSEAEKEALYSNAFAFLFPSLKEGFGIPIIEAACYNCPVVTSNLSSMKEIGEDACVLVDPQDPADIAKGLSSLLDENVRASVVEKQHKKMARFTWEESYRQIMEAIVEIKAG